MIISELKDRIKDYGKDLRLNLTSVLSEAGAPGLTPLQMWGVAMACAFFTKNKSLMDSVVETASAHVSSEVVQAAKSAATIMAMNNVYYRFNHSVEDPEFSKMPARLRMMVIGNPGIAKVDFEAMCLAVSAMEGCTRCINAHVYELKKAGLSNEGIQSAVRIAAVLNGAAQALEID